ncbi:unnamed protein product, partial [Scytosiphon promiscuus]
HGSSCRQSCAVGKRQIEPLLQNYLLLLLSFPVVLLIQVITGPFCLNWRLLDMASGTQPSQAHDFDDPGSDGPFEEDGRPDSRGRGLGGSGAPASSHVPQQQQPQHRRSSSSSGRRRVRRRHRAAAGHRAEDLKTYDPKDIGPDEYVMQMTTFLERRYLSTIHATIVSAADQEKDYSLAVNAQDLVHFDSRLAYLVLHRPDLLLELMREALGEVQARIVAEDKADGEANSGNSRVDDDDGSGVPARPTVKGNAHIRITHLPPLSDLCKPNISAIRGTDLGALIQIQGTVIRSGAAKMLEVSREYRCQNKTCGAVFSVHSDMSQGNLLAPPTSCPGVGEKQCKGTRFLEHGEHKYSDYQEIKVQEQAQKLSVGSIPRSMVILLQDDLVDSCKAGDDVVVVGELLRRWMPVFEGVRCDVQVTLRANSVTVQSGSDQGSSQVSEELRQEFVELWEANAHRPLAVRNHVIASVCPQIFGLFTVKLAILLTLIGGVTETDPRGMRRRGTPHLLVVGDPGCGKSQFLRFAAKLSPRSVLTTGVGTTSAGLTCSAVKDGGEWMLEAGALVLADRGLCCIDEFSAIREHDRATIHEAMEQQTLSVAKAGLVCKLNARTTVFAVTNTKGAYDAAEDMTVNTAIGSPLLSRFDLVLLLLDTKNKHWDKVVSTFVLRAAIGPAAPPARPKPAAAAAAAATAAAGTRRGSGGGGGGGGSSSPKGNSASDGNGGRGGDDPVSSTPWGTEKLQKYLCYVKDTFTSVRLSREAEEVVARYYQSQRSADNRSAARTTVRLLESLIRLAQAHARLMCRTEVTLQDAVVSVICVETSLHSTGRLGVDSVLHSDFPPNPDEEFELHQGLILDRLKLSHLHRKNAPPPPPDPPSASGGSGPSRGSQSQRSSQRHDYEDDASGQPSLTAEAAAAAAAASATAAAAARRDEWAARKAASASGGGGGASGRSTTSAGAGNSSGSAFPAANNRSLSQDATRDSSQGRLPRGRHPGGSRSSMGASTPSMHGSRGGG